MKLPTKKTLSQSATLITGLVMIFLWSFLVGCTDTPNREEDRVIRTIKAQSYKDVLALFNELDYTSEQWQAGIRTVPRIEVTHIPQRWQDQSPDIPVKDKKNVFFRLIGPGILLANEKILTDRKQLLDAIQKKDIKDNKWLRNLALKYKVIKEDADALDQAALNKLVNRVDIIPVSLALAQSAEESGWGASRFAVKGNSLFGQWDFSGKGMKPKEQRKHLGNYGLAIFDTPMDSIEAYMLNLNTHRAYQRLRDMRADFRKRDKEPTGWELAKTLDQYSERREKYVKSLHGLMKHNKLNDADQAVLWKQGIIIISPSS